MTYELHNGDCLEVMKTIPDASVDMILCDLPYGTTACAWDTIIPFDKLWEQYTRIIKHKGSIALFGQEPFSSKLRLSNLDMYKYDWYWKKSRPSGFVNAKLKPLKDIEIISIFSKANTANGSSSNMVYNPQGIIKINEKWMRPKNYVGGATSPARKSNSLEMIRENSNYPRQILEFSNPNRNVLHPTQKPVDLMMYMIKTYTHENEIVLDNCMGSGTTGVAATNLNRKFIGIELDKIYFDIAKKRILEAYETTPVDITKFEN